MCLAKRMAERMTLLLGCDGFNIVQNNNEVAGQTVFHFHMHLIPRYTADENGEMIWWKAQKFSDEVETLNIAGLEDVVDDETEDDLAKKLAQK